MQLNFCFLRLFSLVPPFCEHILKLWPVVVTFRAVVVAVLAAIVVVVAVIMSIRQFKVFKWFKWRLCLGSSSGADPRRVSLTTIRIMRGVDDGAVEKDQDEG